MTKTSIQFDEVIAECRDLFYKKQSDYGASFRVLRALSVIDQILIKVKSLRNFQMTGVSRVGESETENFIAIVNYSIIGLIQIQKGFADDFEADRDEMMELYDHFAAAGKALMERKNHDYGEAWRDMEISSITDMIYQKILRMKMILKNNEKTEVSEGLDANFYDMLNYAVFSLIKINEEPS
ncbi:DUF1599 domain-containing protein [Chryseobacterium sp. MFBS3-17]|uniref:DUF1599 domain-containing protein n=1 Tax=Chryseobacterium sp. MFBS3-17 TaxID=2886689 RepID=UPI001D0F41C4|nr:DUF1599 domain-containing protein [Chryseobacterium sp. MFBS3-17]MCC2591440.1 DUF1599 domain-containing protein [Chryseobacterium sp. MFBS3-17]